MKTDKIIILGGGSAGWISAATLISQFPNKDITVIEAPDLPIISVGESTIAPINSWLTLIGIEDKEFMPHCDATYKLSIRFEDFYKLGDGGFHYPFGQPSEEQLNYGKQTWFVKRYLEPETPNYNYAEFNYPIMSLVNNNTIYDDEKDEQKLPGYSFKHHAAYHFDSGKFGQYLKIHFCMPKGVKYIQEKITDIKQDENGIVSLNGHKADLFIDCSGFRSLLIGETLKEPFNDYTHILPNNKAWVVQIPYTDKETQIKLYTNCHAIENGWVWTVPTWSRMGTGYTYSNKFVSKMEALNEYKVYLDGQGFDYSNSEFRHLSVNVGVRERLFVKNVIGMGLSGGFIEPLESNGLFSVHEYLTYLVKIMKRGDNITQWDKDSFNHACRFSFDEFSEFVSIHYSLTQRDDTEYWRDISERSFVNQGLTTKGNLSTMEVRLNDGQYFNSTAGVHCISSGFGYHSIDYTEIINWDKKIIDISRQECNHRDGLVSEWDDLAKTKRSAHQFLKDEIYEEYPAE